MGDLLVASGAELSDCGKYRYALWRRWDKTRPRLVFIMLNPSTADAEKDDATIRVCMRRARRMGFGGIRVLNLFAWRATDPRELAGAPAPVGPQGDRYLERYLGSPSMGEMNIAAWGDGGLAKGIRRSRWREALSIICDDMGMPLYSLGLTRAGQPKHPLRIAYAVEPTLWMDRDRFYPELCSSLTCGRLCGGGWHHSKP